MGEDVIDRAAEVAGLEPRPSQTLNLLIHGWTEERPPAWEGYGSDAENLKALCAGEPSLARPLHARLPGTEAQVVWAARFEMARTVEDVLSRRTRALLLDARASAECAPRVAALLARELSRDAAWQESQVRAYRVLARRYLP